MIPPVMVPIYDIQLALWDIDLVHEVEIDSTWDRMTDTATIQLPKTLKFGNVNIEEAIKTGDRVIIRLGCDGEFFEEFRGYVSRSPAPNIPFTIYCEDEMWKLKTTSCDPKTWRKVSLKELVEHIAPGYKYDVMEAELGSFRIEKDTSPAKVLKDIEDVYGLRSFFRGETLVVGKVYTSNDVMVLPVVNYEYGVNLISGTDRLEYVRKEDHKVKVKAISMHPDNTKYEVEEGDEGGDTRTLTFYNLGKVELKKRAQEHIEKFKVDGYTGSVETFGIDRSRHGQKCRLIDNRYEQRNSTYFIDRVRIRSGINGYRREVFIGPRA
jgi:hypothetical protein